MKIAIIAVAYNRVDSLSRLLVSLDSAYYDEKENVPLIISIDKSNTDIVEKFADNYQWKHGNKIVKKHEKNLGLREHILSLGEWFDNFDALIIFEDDLVVSPNFYTYARQTIDKYSASDDVAGISLYSFHINYQTGLFFVPLKSEYDVYFMNCAMSWGQIWVKKQWQEFYKWYQSHLDFPPFDHLPQTICRWKKSWLKYHTRYCIETNKYFVHPYTALSTNCSDMGTHVTKSSSAFQVVLQNGKKDEYFLPDLDSKDAVFYDGFFENKMLYKYLGMKDAACCIDINKMKGNRLKKRYWLTTQVYNYKVIDSYGLSFRPIEENIIRKVPGRDIFLYDTSISERNKNRRGERNILYNYYITNIVNLIKRYGITNTFDDFVEKIKAKLHLLK